MKNVTQRCKLSDHIFTHTFWMKILESYFNRLIPNMSHCIKNVIVKSPLINTDQRDIIHVVWFSLRIIWRIVISVRYTTLLRNLCCSTVFRKKKITIIINQSLFMSWFCGTKIISELCEFINIKIVWMSVARRQELCKIFQTKIFQYYIMF